MARIRTIKPEFWTDAIMVQLPFEARLTFIGLWNFCDDDGLIEYEPDQIKMLIMPGNDVDISVIVDILVAADRLSVLVLEDGTEILQINNFAKHQKISHKTASKFNLKGARKQIVPAEVRRQIALKYGCKPGESSGASCYYCGADGLIWWPRLNSGRPSGWVAFGGLEIGHFVPENSGGDTAEKNLVLSCRYCNRSKGARHPFDQFEIMFPENSGALRPEGKGKERKGVARAREAIPESTGDPPDKPKPVDDIGPWLTRYCDHVTELWATPNIHAPKKGVDQLRAWQADGIDLEKAWTVVKEILDRRRKTDQRPPGSMGYFDEPVREKAHSAPAANGVGNLERNHLVEERAHLKLWRKAKDKRWRYHTREPKDDAEAEKRIEQITARVAAIDNHAPG